MRRRCRAARSAASCSPPSTPSAWPAWSSSARGSRSAALRGAALAAAVPPARATRFTQQATDHDARLGKFNPHYWTHDGYADFVQWWAERMLPEPHSTKQIEDAVAVGARDRRRDARPEHGCAGAAAPATRRDQIELARRVRCPVLVIHGTKDQITPYADGKALAKITGGRLETVEGAGPPPAGAQAGAGEPRAARVRRRHAAARSDRRTGRTAASARSTSPRRSASATRSATSRSPASCAGSCTASRSTGSPRTRSPACSRRRASASTPRSAHLANESQHIESESAEHDLHCFQALRRMDEILIANFMVFHDVVREERYDLWIGDEAWELDYYLHENPREKRARYAWLTDFVGWLPMPDGGEREAYLTADYNAEMVEHIAEHPEVRDRAIFVGNPDDIVDERLGPQLPMIRDWTERNFDFAGYVTGFDPPSLGDRDELRDELGYRPRRAGLHRHRRRLGRGRRSAAARDRLLPRRQAAGAGPAHDRRGRAAHRPGLAARSPTASRSCAYVHNLYRHLAACDLAVVQGGLTTAMELTASRRPFLYFPLRHHFEQNLHVAPPARPLRRRPAHGLRRGRRRTSIAAAIAEEIGRDVDYREVETDGARRAAEKLAELL